MVIVYEGLLLIIWNCIIAWYTWNYIVEYELLISDSWMVSTVNYYWEFLLEAIIVKGLISFVNGNHVIAWNT